MSGGRKMQPDAVARLSEDRSAPTESAGTNSHSAEPSAGDPSRRFLADLERRIGSQDFRHWFGNHVVVRIDGTLIAIEVARPFLMSWLQRTFHRSIQSAAIAVVGEAAAVSFELSSQLSARRETVRDAGQLSPADRSASAKPEANAKPALPVPIPPRSAVPQTSLFRKTRKNLAELDEFVVADEDEPNRLPLMAAAQIAAHPGERRNPLYLYGNTGCGKTHLLEGIARRIQATHRDLRVELLTAEQFTNSFLHSMHRKTGPQFRQRFRTVDALLIDNVDFLAGKPGTQREFLHTFDELLARRCQIVLTAKCHPRLLTDILPDLTSRFGSGLACRLEMPDAETRLEICRRRALSLGARIKPAALRLVADKFKRNVRDMLGAVTTLATQFELTGKPVSGNAAGRLLADDERDRKPPPTPKQIERAVCEFFHITPADLRSESRSQALTVPRSVAIYLIRHHTAQAYSQIGSHFGGRSHSTVMRAERRIRDGLSSSQAVRIAGGQRRIEEVIEAIEQRFAG